MMPSDYIEFPNSTFTKNIGRSWRRLREPLTYVVEPSHDVHGTINPNFICYSGEECVLQDLTSSKIRANALRALNDM